MSALASDPPFTYDAGPPPAWLRPCRRPVRFTGANGGELADGDALAREVFGPRALNDRSSSATAFFYLWRRFGPPNSGSDDHKELCRYNLGTANRNVILTIAPRSSGIALGVGYLVSPKLLAAVREPLDTWHKRWGEWYVQEKIGPDTEDARWDARIDEAKRALAAAALGPPPLPPNLTQVGRWRTADQSVRDANKALFDALRDLLRPVRLHGDAFDLFGPCRFADDIDHEAPPSPLAGQLVPVAAMNRAVKKRDAVIARKIRRRKP